MTQRVDPLLFAMVSDNDYLGWAVAMQLAAQVLLLTAPPGLDHVDDQLSFVRLR